MTRERVRAGPSFQLGTLSTRIASRAARSDVDLIYSADRRAPGQPDTRTASQTDSTQLKYGNKSYLEVDFFNAQLSYMIGQL